MGTILNKLWASKNTIIIILSVVVFAWVYTLDYTRKPVRHAPLPAGKSLEQIMATPVDNAPEPDWDTEFKSVIEAAE